MTKKIVIAEKDNIAAVLDNDKVSEFFVSKGDVLLGDVYLSVVDNILPSIDAAFVDVGMSDKMGFIHTDDISGKGTLKEKVKPKQKLIVQVVKEPTGHKGPRVTTALSLPGRFLVLLPEEKGVNVSRKIVSNKERARLKSIVSLLKPVGVGVIVRTEAENQSEAEIQEDLEILLEKWNSIVNAADTANPPCLLYRDQDLLYRVIREACTEDVDEIIVDTAFALHRTTQLLQHWNMKIKVSMHKGNDPLLIATGVNKEIHNALQTRVNLPLGGYLFIQQTEALTVVDVNSGKFTSSSSQAETILKTNLEAADEIARQLKLRNIGGMVIVDFIDMITRADKLRVLEHFELALEKDKAKPQIGQLSDLGLVELTRHRQGQSLSEIFTKKCDKCQGQGFVIEDLRLLNSNAQGEARAKINKIKGPFSNQQNNQSNPNNQNGFNKNNFNKNKKFDKRNDYQKNNSEQNNQNAVSNNIKPLDNQLVLESVKQPSLDVEENKIQETNSLIQNEQKDTALASNTVTTAVAQTPDADSENKNEAKEESKTKRTRRNTRKTKEKTVQTESSDEQKSVLSSPVALLIRDDEQKNETQEDVKEPKKTGPKRTRRSKKNTDEVSDNE